jgi:hypothetical protein
MSTRVRSAIATVLVLTTTFTPGCGTIIGKASDQPVAVNSDPAGARLSIDGVSTTQMTPCTVELDPKDDHSIQATLGDMKASSAVRKKVRIWVVVIDGILTAGIGVFVDYMTGALYTFDPGRLQLNLGRQPQPVTPPPVALTNGNGNTGTGNTGTGNTGASSSTTNMLQGPKCQYCGEPRGTGAVCPHCGME